MRKGGDDDIKCSTISGGYGNEPVINDVSFQVHKGELFGIIGPNGSGKTTLLKNDEWCSALYEWGVFL